ncbi:hypothetical protein CLU79DRAFT_830751 [Phycomyces nitens]|nr:hypothetical protein CLU79DRAFT_830751 [Phycomyces nitens]
MDFLNQSTTDVTASGRADPWFCPVPSILDGQSQPLQEPVPFEDFKFSFGLDPDFAVPVLFDEPPLLDPIQLSEDPFSFPFPPPDNDVLDEDDQKIFSAFLDTFFMEQDSKSTADTLPNLSSLFDSPDDYPLSLPFPALSQTDKHVFMEHEEERRRSSILQSLDHQKHLIHQRFSHLPSLTAPDDQLMLDHTQAPLNDAASDRSPISPIIPLTSTFAQSTSAFRSLQDRLRSESVYIQPERSSTKRQASDSVDEDDESVRHASSVGSEGRSPKRNKPQKELLTEEEKRTNHIASEQKRRSTIRTGFKDLTDIVPTLKNINNSKSAVLFKAVEYIRYLEKRTKSLHEKVNGLEVRVEVEGKAKAPPRSQPMKIPSLGSTNLPRKQPKVVEPDTKKTSPVQDNASHHRARGYHGHKPTPERSTEVRTPNSEKPSLISTTTAAALLAHKAQQQQLIALQEQLQLHQKILAQQQKMRERTKAQQGKIPPLLDTRDKRSQFHRHFLPTQSRTAFHSPGFDNVGFIKPIRPDPVLEVESEERLKTTVSA